MLDINGVKVKYEGSTELSKKTVIAVCVILVVALVFEIGLRTSSMKEFLNPIDNHFLLYISFTILIMTIILQTVRIIKGVIENKNVSQLDKEIKTDSLDKFKIKEIKQVDASTKTRKHMITKAVIKIDGFLMNFQRKDLISEAPNIELIKNFNQNTVKLFYKGLSNKIIGIKIGNIEFLTENKVSNNAIEVICLVVLMMCLTILEINKLSWHELGFGQSSNFMTLGFLMAYAITAYLNQVISRDNENKLLEVLKKVN